MTDASLLLFGSAFLAATILPFSSEVVLFALLREGRNPVSLGTASLGNTLGAVVNWALDRYLLHYQDRRWFYFSRVQIEKAQRWFQRYGFWSLLLAWMPVGGDTPTLIAGIMKVRLWLFLLLVGTGKTLRYVSVVYVAAWEPF